ncbi:unnamed protein product [Thelazia callipaeda]|uniref:Protein SHQ1 homolog n=1 Tax=Thelazia callipaeda TaxID=103827 RepID=A0A0N5D397_THECL|nr:unnamed protein product [Thelazia callipaeda]
MLTPKFEIDQNSTHVIIKIYAPYANIKDAEAQYCNSRFYFTSKPYFLKLYLSGELAEEGLISGTYNCDEGNLKLELDLCALSAVKKTAGSFTFKAPKKNKGESFPNLDLVSKLMKPSEIHTQQLVTEIIDDDDYDDFTLDLRKRSQADETSDFDNVVEEKCKLYGYGFTCNRIGVLGKFSEEIVMVDLENPEDSLISRRVDDCLHYDQQRADLFERNDSLSASMQFEYLDDTFNLSLESRMYLKSFPKKKFHHPPSVHKIISLSLIDILFAYLYDMRTTEGEHCSESGWTIAKLSPTLSYLVSWRTAKEALVGAIRRSLCYPLYRSWNLSLKVADDLKFLLSRGRLSLLRCLIDVHMIFSKSGDFRYLLNDLFITDYCLWLQFVPDTVLGWLSSEVMQLKLTKNDMQLGLEEVEIEAYLRILQVDNGSDEVIDSDDDSS